MYGLLFLPTKSSLLLVCLQIVRKKSHKAATVCLNLHLQNDVKTKKNQTDINGKNKLSLWVEIRQAAEDRLSYSRAKTSERR